MTFPANSIVEALEANATIHTGTPGSVSNGAFSASGDIAAWTNTQNAKWGHFKLKAAFASGVSDVVIAVYARPINVISTDDAVAPGTSHHGHCIGHFVIYAAAGSTTYVFVSERVRLPNAGDQQQFEFYLENLTGVTLNSGWELYLAIGADTPSS